MNGRMYFGRAAAGILIIGASLVLGGCVSPRAAPTPIATEQVPTGFPARCAPGEVEVMLLGTYHFAGSSADAVRTPAEDILSPGRQAELGELARLLARWSPDQIAVEWPLSFADSTTARFQRYVTTGTTQSRNEVVQIGFRLAQRLGHPKVYPVDHQMGIGNDSIQPLFARRPEFEQRRNDLLAVLQRRADSVSIWRRNTSLIEHLRAENTEEAMRSGNSLSMFGSFLPAGEGLNLGGPQLLARWYERNIIMAHNLTRILRPDTRRVLLVVGSGHVRPLRNILDESPQFCPVSPLPYLR